MSSETQGMFGPNGLLAKVEAQNSGESMAMTLVNLQEEVDEKNSQNPTKRVKVDVDKNEQEKAQLKQEPNPSGKELINLNEIPLQVEGIPLSSLPAIDAVFSIEEIRKQIFGPLSLADLKSSRHMSRAWRIYATNDILLNRKTNYLKMTKLRTQFESDCRHSAHSFVGGTIGTMRQLTELMDNTGQNPFPCNSFSIINKETIAEDRDLDNFLNNHGFRIKNLYLKLNYAKPFKPFLKHKFDFLEAILIQLIVKVITQQAPHLESLKMNISSSFSSSKFKDLPKSVQGEIQAGYGEAINNANLKFVTIEGDIPKSLLERILQMAPNLICFNVNDLQFYLKPENRLHLCSYLKFHPATDSLIDYNKCLINVIANMEGKLNLKELDLGMYFLCDYNCPDLWSQVSDTCNKIFEKCRHSLETLSLQNMNFLPGLKFPKMTKLQCLKFPPWMNQCQYRLNCFPKGTSLSECFPNLRIIELCVTNEVIHSNEFPLGGDDHFLTSVKITRIENIRRFKDTEIASALHRWFPNAKIVVRK